MEDTMTFRPPWWWTGWFALVFLGGIWLGAYGQGGTVNLLRLGLVILLPISIESYIHIKLRPAIQELNRNRIVSRIVTSAGSVLAAAIVLGAIIGSQVWWQYLGRYLWSEYETQRKTIVSSLKALGYTMGLRLATLVTVLLLIFT